MKHDLDDILGELRRKHREVSAPPHLEARLRSATRARRRWHIHPWLVAAAALFIVAIATWRMNMRQPGRPTQQNAQLTDFVAVPGSEALPVPAGTIILRMELTRGDLRRYGANISPAETTERVQADFVIGDDGLARAVRFVR